jgi:hypothetical protein
LISKAAEAEQQDHNGTTAEKPTYHGTQDYHEPEEASIDEVDGA